MQIIDLPAHVLSERIHSKEISCVEVLNAYLSRIQLLNPKFNAIVNLVDPSELLKIAQLRDTQLSRGESMGWMHGMPIAIKDLSSTAGIKTTQGSPIYKDFIPKTDALMVQRIKEAGAILIGKTNTPEFGLGSHTFNDLFGVTSNAYDPTKSAGGSSGGAAVAVALQMLPVADGSDFMGSLRNPAGWNNIFGMRPSFGRVPSSPVGDFYTAQLSTEGPMAKNVTDLAALLEIQSGPDLRAPLSLEGKLTGLTKILNQTPASIKIAWLGDLNGYLPMEIGIQDTCLKALQHFTTTGPHGSSLDLVKPNFTPESVWQTWLVWRQALTAAKIAPHLKNPDNRALFKPEALWEFDESIGLEFSTFSNASAQRGVFYQQMLEYFKSHDVLALPSAQVWPFDKSWRYPKEIKTASGLVSMDTYHRWMEVVIYATLAGLPCISVPAGFGSNGLPIGIQLIGKPRGDSELLQIAFAYAQTIEDVLKIKPTSN